MTPSSVSSVFMPHSFAKTARREQKRGAAPHSDARGATLRFHFWIGRGNNVTPTAPQTAANYRRHRNRPAAATGSWSRGWPPADCPRARQETRAEQNPRQRQERTIGYAA